MARVEVTGVRDLMYRIDRTAKKVEDVELDLVRKMVGEIKQLAQRYAPRDTGALEDAIEAIQIDRGGLHGRHTFYVGVNPESLGMGYQAYGFRYDIWAHEAHYKLGKRSEEKADDLGLPKYGQFGVGREFLARAAMQKEEEWVPKFEAAVARALRSNRLI